MYSHNMLSTIVKCKYKALGTQQMPKSCVDTCADDAISTMLGIGRIYSLILASILQHISSMQASYTVQHLLMVPKQRKLILPNLDRAPTKLSSPSAISHLPLVTTPTPFLLYNIPAESTPCHPPSRPLECGCPSYPSGLGPQPTPSPH